MERAGEFLGKALRRLNRPEAALAWLESAWPTVVGHALAAHAQPMRCHNGLLELAASSKAWQKQLQSMQGELCNRINQAWGGTLVRELKFVDSKPAPARVPREADNHHTPFIRRRS